MKRNWLFKLFFVFLIVLLFTQPAFALGPHPQENPPLTLPPELILFARALVIALASWLTYHIVEGAKKYVPWLTGPAAQFAAVVTATLLSSFDQLVLLANNLLGSVTDPYLTILIKTVFFALLAWIGSQGLFLKDKKQRLELEKLTNTIKDAALTPADPPPVHRFNK